MNYTLNQLRIFQKVCEIKSITKCAEELHLSQPAISIQLKNLQNQFDVPLYEIINRKVFITDFGKEIEKIATEILKQVSSIDLKTHNYKGLLTGQLKISLVSSGKYVMPYFLTGFLDKHPHIDLKMEVTNKLKVLESLDKNKLDFALVSVLPKNIEVEHFELFKNELYLMGSPKLNISKIKNTTELFKKNRFLYREEGSATRSVMEAFIKKNNFPVQKKIELQSSEAVKQAAISGMGFSIMPIAGVKNELENKSLEIIPFKGLPITSSWFLIWQKEKNHSPVAKSFIKYVKENLQSILQSEFSWIQKLK